MKPPICFQKGGRIRSLIPPAFLTLLIFFQLGNNRIFAGGVVTNCTEANLRAAMAGGGLVTFACDGTITLSKTITNSLSATLNGTGHQITISGGNAVRVFYVNTNVNFKLMNLVVADGRGANGAG